MYAERLAAYAQRSARNARALPAGGCQTVGHSLGWSGGSQGLSARGERERGDGHGAEWVGGGAV